jgi:hypothetical protein
MDQKKKVEMARTYFTKKRRRNPQKALKWNPEGTRKSGRPKETWTIGGERIIQSNGIYRVILK